MSDSLVQVAPDSTGKKIQTFENTVNAQTVEAQAVVVVDPSGSATTERVPAISVQTDASNSPVAAGNKSVAFIISSDFSGTILTAAIDPNAVSNLGFEAPPGDTLAEIAYTIDAGSLTILSIT